MQFFYVMDPMCAWCYGFEPELTAFLQAYPTAEVSWIMGGLAPDNSQPMSDDLKRTIAAYWYDIEKRSQVMFNHNYWQLNTPYRSTYPACRAVIAAEKLEKNSAGKMVKAIQSAYYQQAGNPSLEATLKSCASAIGLDEAQFVAEFKSEQTEQTFQQHLAISHQLQVSGFPALFYIDEEKRAYPLTLGFCETVELNQRFSQLKQSLIVAG